MIRLTQKDSDILKNISHVAGIFTLVVAMTMLFSYIQLKTIDPLDNPAFVSLKEEYDKEPENAKKIEQVRAMDLMARKAYFATRSQVETGAYLLLAGSIIFIICQRLIVTNIRVMPSIPGAKADLSGMQKYGQRLMIISASVITLAALGSSFVLRGTLPDPERGVSKSELSGSNGDEPEEMKNTDGSFAPDPVNFPFFRGQDSRGIAGGKGYPVEWNVETGLNIKWKLKVPGEGKSSPVIWGDKLFITAALGKEGQVYCVDKNSGEILWSSSASGIEGEPEELPEMDAESGLAVPTAAVSSDFICAIFANGNIACFDHDGTRKWAKNLSTMKNIYGYSSSLVIFEKTVIVQHDSDSRLSIMGFDIETGELLWETMRNGRPVWSSPVIATFDGKPQVLINGNPSVTAFDPTDGKELWSVECLTGDVAPSLAVNSSMIYAVTDYQKLAAVRPGAGASIVWEDNTYTSDVSSPVANDEILVIATGFGDVACYNAQKGDTLWTHTFMDPFYASPVIADNMIYMIDRNGKAFVVRAGDKFEQIAESSMGERVDCTPAFSDKMIYIRGKENLYCIAKSE
ncbi:MAG: PQQ-binding-like beta-propeller repeat protein [Bacteroidetes bacterium]|nr:PQQ-binding-like beta-propeller repeat protein [Bacteroidota bacterium]